MPQCTSLKKKKSVPVEHFCLTMILTDWEKQPCFLACIEWLPCFILRNIYFGLAIFLYKHPAILNFKTVTRWLSTNSSLFCLMKTCAASSLRSRGTVTEACCLGQLRALDLPYHYGPWVGHAALGRRGKPSPVSLWDSIVLNAGTLTCPGTLSPQALKTRIFGKLNYSLNHLAVSVSRYWEIRSYKVY